MGPREMLPLASKGLRGDPSVDKFIGLPCSKKEHSKGVVPNDVRGEKASQFDNDADLHTVSPHR